MPAPRRLRSLGFLLAVALVAQLSRPADAFNLGRLFGGLTAPGKPAAEAPAAAASAIDQTKQELLRTIANTSNGRDASLEVQRKALQLVRYLETEDPVAANLLDDPEASRALDGLWYLQYTAPSDLDDTDDDDLDAWTPENASEGDARIDTRPVKLQGSVRASGIVVDTANKLTTQTIDVAGQRIKNDVEQDFGRISVGGTFRPSGSVGTRAVVAFDFADIELDNLGGFTVRLGFLFDVLAAFKGGIKDNGWLETTYLDSDLRIGRGNKGSLFVLTRDRDAVGA